MKKRIILRRGMTAFLCTAVLAGLTACEADTVEQQGGKLPDKESVGHVNVMLGSAGAVENTVDILLTEGNGYMMSNFYLRQTQPAAAGYSLDVRVDESLLDDYEAPDEIERKLLPEANYEFPDGKSISLSDKAQYSDIKRIKFLSEGLTEGEYVLPLTVAAQDAPDANKTLYYNVSVRTPYKDEYPLHDPEHFFFVVFYVNTNDFDPRLALDFLVNFICKRDQSQNWGPEAIGHIVNLRTVMIDYDAASGRALLNLGNDMRYVLDHAVKYIRPLQEQGRKVCISIEGGGKGLGFCNLTDEQIKDFTSQVKNVVEEFGIDGINLWDRNSGYGKEGMPEMNTTSYPKLIKALREALGREKLLTVSVYDKPTETFYDVDASGGIAVGEYIDYAWSGYNSDKEAFQLLDPWHPYLEYVSKYTQKPIAGLPKEKFGCMNCPIYGTDFSNNTEEFSKQDELVTNGFREWGENYKNSNILVYADLIANLQDKYEGYWDMYFTNWFRVMDPYCDAKKYKSKQRNSYNMDLTRWWEVKPGNSNYGKWVKDWD